VAVYAGMFDPITNGHLSVIERSARLFDRFLVVVAVNPAKTPLFSAEERVSMIRNLISRWPNVECEATAGLVVDLARRNGAQFLVRGVRGCTDVEAEIALSNMNHELAPEIETVFIPAHPQLSEVSSSRLKQLVSEGMDVSRYCSPEVALRLNHRVTLRALPKGNVVHV
jgi:pantetheine-phosphate adenylyltransferase